jgi:hypothetical protein
LFKLAQQAKGTFYKSKGLKTGAKTLITLCRGKIIDAKKIPKKKIFVKYLENKNIKEKNVKVNQKKILLGSEKSNVKDKW